MIDDRHWAWCDGVHHPVRRDARVDDPDYYYRVGHGWTKKTVWTVDNEPDCSNRDEYMRFFNETSPEQRSVIRAERRRRFEEEMRAQGLVRWREAWVTPERRDEMRETYLENMRRSNEATWRAKQMMSGGGLSRWNWC